MTVDTRAATEYGVVRTFADMVYTWTGGGQPAPAPASPVVLLRMTLPIRQEAVLARLAAPTSACTTRSSSSLGSRLVGRSFDPFAPLDHPSRTSIHHVEVWYVGPDVLQDCIARLDPGQYNEDVRTGTPTLSIRHLTAANAVNGLNDGY
jgi:hypothetical protein